MSATEFRMAPAEPGYSTGKFATLKHNYHEHPLFQVPELWQLARELMPLRLCRFPLPDMKQESVFNLLAESLDGESVDQVFERIEKPGSWIALYDIEAIPRYRDLLQNMMAGVRQNVEREQGKILLITGFIFISAPPSVTPYHIDRENNFWLQLHGHKRMTVWNNDDRGVVPAAHIENFIVNRSLRDVRLTESLRSRGTHFDRKPGDGLYFPSTTPHATQATTDWVRPGNALSVSIGVNFYTELTRRHARVHQFNHLMRKFGVAMNAPGRSAIGDRIKAPLGKAVAELKYRRGKYVPPPGTL